MNGNRLVFVKIDCYNLLLRGSPLYLSRYGKEGNYEILCPEKAEFKTEENETVFKRVGDILISSRWYENQKYHEETISAILLYLSIFILKNFI